MILMLYYNHPIVYVMFGLGFAVRNSTFLPSILKLFDGNGDNIGLKMSVIVSIKDFGVLGLLSINQVMFEKYNSYVPMFIILIIL